MSNKLDEQIKNRLMYDDDVFSDAFVSLSEVITDSALLDLFSDRRKTSSGEALEEVLSYYGFKQRIVVPDSIEESEEYLDYVLNPIGVMRRTVVLDDNWFKNAFGAFLGVLDEKYTVALIPSFKGYLCISPTTGEKFVINKKNCSRISKNAICFYPPLPDKRLTIKNIAERVIGTVSLVDVIKIVLFSLIITAVSMLTPYITQYLFNNISLQDSYRPLVSIFIFMTCIYASSYLLSFGKGISITGVCTKADAFLNSSIMMRMLNLEPGFFREYNSGDLQTRVRSSKTMASSTISFIFDTGISVLMSFIYVFQIKSFSPVLVVPSIIIIVALFVFFIIYSLTQNRLSKQLQTARSKEAGFLVSIINGIQKIRLSGSEKRIFSQWAGLYKDRALYQYKPPFIIIQNNTITTFLTLAGSIILYYFSLRSGIDAGTYMGFMSSYGLLSGAFLGLASSVSAVAGIRAQLDQFKPILDRVPESAGGRRSVKKLSGKIDVNKVSFKYTDNQPMIIDNLSLSIKPGEYLGIVGKSGCGKSTLMRLLLGFEKPSRGIISYDSIDLNSLEPKSVRRQIGCVMQDGGLFTDSIRANIALTAPFATDEEVWAAAKAAGIDKDIKAMPMGLETIVFDSSSTISGGQKQRILIARALISKPNILFFDEATSALDNNTQKIITDTLSSLDCTRIVIAHRLSTVKLCDRIVMLEHGRIIEEGSYDELMALNGRFAEMVQRQLI